MATRLPFPMHSPMKNQQPTSTATKVFSQASFMVRLAHLKVMADLTRFAAPPMAAGISVGEGGISSALPYFSAVARRGLAYTVTMLANLAAAILFLSGSKSPDFTKKKHLTSDKS